MRRSGTPCCHRTVLPVLTFVLTILSLASISQAGIIYKNMYVDLVNRGTYNYDFNSDGVTDLTFALKLQQNSCGYVVTASESPAKGNETEGVSLTPLQAGDPIGPNQEFSGVSQTMASLTWNHCGGGVIYGGSWPRSEVRYMGVSFLINGEAHYAWASVEFDVVVTFGPPKLVAKLTGFAYETVPGAAINAGQTK